MIKKTKKCKHMDAYFLGIQEGTKPGKFLHLFNCKLCKTTFSKPSTFLKFEFKE